MLVRRVAKKAAVMKGGPGAKDNTKTNGAGMAEAPANGAAPQDPSGGTGFALCWIGMGGFAGTTVEITSPKVGDKMSASSIAELRQ